MSKRLLTLAQTLNGQEAQVEMKPDIEDEDYLAAAGISGGSDANVIADAREFLKKKGLASNEAMNKFYTCFEVYNVNNYDFFRNPVEAKELIIEALEI